ncbi:disintegrin and metalloproteinase domain-containing protein unc-71-like [Penaeus indicus]|uniref:disintegrin and metalloproteinase domain-containing protein unc-71-like n=1 Tax=Penaeus indicus TaxID=29960 RepID=UPI00300CC322
MTSLVSGAWLSPRGTPAVVAAASVASVTTTATTMGRLLALIFPFSWGSSSPSSAAAVLSPLACLVLALLVLPAPARATSSAASGYSGSQRDDNPDFYEDYMSDESNAYLNGEVRRLLNEHVENSQFVQSLESQFYQITYPVQLQRHGKSQGISTRDASKITEEQAQVQNDRKSNHVHRTSYRIKAFSHVFTVDLELNQQLVSPNLVAHHRTRDGSSNVDQHIEHCYYHGTVKDYSGAIAAFRTCNGLAGIIQLGNETLIVSPMAGGEKLPKHPHFVIESKNSHIRQKCGYHSGYEWGMWERNYNRQNHGRKKKQVRHRYARDVRSTPKFIETALFLDKKFMEDRNYSRVRALNDALQIANIADLLTSPYSSTIGVTVTYLRILLPYS